MLEISAKRQDIFRRVVFSISLYFCNPRFQAAWSCHVAYTHCEREATYILEMSHILLTLQGTKEEKSEGLVEEKAREREHFRQISGKLHRRHQLLHLERVKLRPIPPTQGHFL